MIHINKYQTKDYATQGVTRANSVTESVLTLARLLKVKPEDLADQISADKDNAVYRAKFTARFVENETIKAIDEMEKISFDHKTDKPE